MANRIAGGWECRFSLIVMMILSLAGTSVIGQGSGPDDYTVPRTAARVNEPAADSSVNDLFKPRSVRASVVAVVSVAQRLI